MPGGPPAGSPPSGGVDRSRTGCDAAHSTDLNEAGAAAPGRVDRNERARDRRIPTTGAGGPVAVRLAWTGKGGVRATARHSRRPGARIGQQNATKSPTRLFPFPSAGPIFPSRGRAPPAGAFGRRRGRIAPTREPPCRRLKMDRTWPRPCPRIGPKGGQIIPRKVRPAGASAQAAVQAAEKEQRTGANRAFQPYPPYRRPGAPRHRRRGPFSW